MWERSVQGLHGAAYDTDRCGGDSVCAVLCCARRGPNEVCQSVRGRVARCCYIGTRVILSYVSASRVEYGIHGPDPLSV